MPVNTIPRTGDILINQLPNNAYDVQLTQLENGNVVATWNYANTTLIAARLFTRDGAPVGDEFRVNSLSGSGSARPDIAALPDGGFSITYKTSENFIWIEQFNANGTRKMAGYTVNSDTSQYWGEFPSIAVLADGRTVVTWSTNNQSSAKNADGDASAVFAQIIGANGNKIGGNFLVNTTVANYQLNPSVTALSNGGFVIAWDTKAVTNNANYGVYAQVYSATGARVGGEITLNTHVGGMQEGVRITALESGGFVAVWQSYGQGTDSEWGIYGQRFSATGARVGGEFHVNSTTDRNQLDPVVTALEDGGFLVAWEANPFLSSSGTWQVQILGQRYAANGAPIGGEFRLNQTDIPSSTSNRPDVIGTDDGGFMAAFVRPGTGGYEVVLRDFTIPSVVPPLPPTNGGPGNDRLTGTAGADVRRGAGGNDTLIGLGGNDSLFGDTGNDRLEGGPGADQLWGGDGRDRLLGAGGNDRLSGGAAADTLDGGIGNDRLAGDGGNDLLKGGGGRDVLDGGRGADRLSGGIGADDFVFSRGYGRDVITDFRVAQDDELRLSARLWSGRLDAGDVVDRFGTRIDGDAALGFANGDVIIFDGVRSLAAIEDQIVIF